MTDYNKLSEKIFYEAMESFGIIQSEENGYKGIELNASVGDTTKLLAAMSHFQVNLYAATLRLYVTLMNDGNDEFYLIKNYRETMQKIINDKTEEITEEIADGRMYSSRTEKQ